jgi:hypothetical protein
LCHPTERKVRSEDGEQPGSDTGHPIEPFEGPKRAMCYAIGDDGLGKCQADSWKAGQLLWCGTIDVYSLVEAQRAGEGENAVAVSRRRLGGKCSDELDFAGRLTGTSGEPANSLPGQPQREQEE